jgi:hypothetical protein
VASSSSDPTHLNMGAKRAACRSLAGAANASRCIEPQAEFVPCSKELLLCGKYR